MKILCTKNATTKNLFLSEFDQKNFCQKKFQKFSITAKIFENFLHFLKIFPKYAKFWYFSTHGTKIFLEIFSIPPRH